MNRRGFIGRLFATPLAFKMLVFNPNATRKLKAAWTPELDQDLRAYHLLSAEDELCNTLSRQISNDIDKEILNTLLTENVDDVS